MTATGFLDACGFNPASGGTGNFVVAAAITGYQTPASAGAVNGATYSYRAQSSDLTQWEEGFGAYTVATTTLARTTVTANSLGTTAAVSFTAAPNVFITALSADLANASLMTGGTLPAPQLGNVSGGFLNKFRNGTMDVWQRGTSSITVTTAGAYTADGWIVTPTGASCTATRAANNRAGAGTLYGLQLTGATSVTDITLTQRIESSVAAALAGKTVTVQAQVYNNTGAAITPTLTTRYAGSADTWTSPVTDLAATGLQACASGAWTQVACTLNVSASATNGYAFIFDFGNNFSTTGKDVVVGELDVRVTPAVATGLNASPPLPELRPVAIEVKFCFRYYYAWSGSTRGCPGYANDTFRIFNFTLPNQMRATPAVSGVSSTWGAIAATTVSQVDVNFDYNTGSASTSGAISAWVASAEL
jgi:hypothetical protein